MFVNIFPLLLVACPSWALRVSSPHRPEGPNFLVSLQGYPASHRLLLAQAKALLSSGYKVDLLLTSHKNATLSAEPNIVVNGIEPLTFCRKGCNNAEADGKMLGALFMSKYVQRGFDWLLIGDDDTTFFLKNIAPALKGLDPFEPHFFALGSIDGKAKQPADDHLQALQKCPSLGAIPRWVSYDRFEDVTKLRGDCNYSSFQSEKWFKWPHGGEGMVISAGLLDKIPNESMQKCIDRLLSFGGDVRVAQCLRFHGFEPANLPNRGPTPKSIHKLSAIQINNLIKKGAKTFGRQSDDYYSALLSVADITVNTTCFFGELCNSTVVST